MTDTPLTLATINCPYCQRWLATRHEDGTIDLASKASATFTTTLDWGSTRYPGAISQARCNLWRCRLQRWLPINRQHTEGGRHHPTMTHENPRV